jgi:hypothetical protein
LGYSCPQWPRRKQTISRESHSCCKLKCRLPPFKTISHYFHLIWFISSFFHIQGDTTHTIELLEEESIGEFAATGIEQEIRAEQVVDIIVEFEYRQVQVDRAINPHGEHAEELFTIPITSLPSQ